MTSQERLFESQEGVVYESSGEKILAVLFVPSEEGKRPAVILCHGFPGIEKNYDLAEKLRESGFVVLMPHYRGSWGSDGSFRFLNLPQDITAALDYMDGVEKVDASRIALIGYSLGGWGSVVVASQDKRPNCIVALAALSDLRLFKVQRLFEDFKFVKGLTTKGAINEWRKMTDRLNPVDIVGKISPRPLLIVHGDLDPVVGIEHARLLLKKAREPKMLYVVRGGDHRFTGKRRLMINKIAKWLKENL